MSTKKEDEKRDEQEKDGARSNPNSPKDNVEVKDNDKRVLNEQTARFDIDDVAKSKKTSIIVDDKSASSETTKSRIDFYLRIIKHQTTTAHCRGRMVNYRFTDVIKIITEVQEIFKNEPMLAKQRRPCVVVGDIHGQYGDLMRAFQFFAVGRKPGYLLQRYVFLGDYVDRGKQSLECIILLFTLKIKFPEMFVLLRGNHETTKINKKYGFHEELNERFPNDQANTLYDKFNKCFQYMPIACVIANQILCMHGGISKELKTLDDIRNIPRPCLPKPEDKLALDILWSDPVIGMKEGFGESVIRGVGCSFGETDVTNLLDKLKLRLVIRGHQVMMNGFNFFAGRKLVTIFTASHYYPGKMNRGAVALIDGNGSIGFKTIVPHYGGVSEGGEKVFRGSFNNDKDEEFKTTKEKEKDRRNNLKKAIETEDEMDKTVPD